MNKILYTAFFGFLLFAFILILNMASESYFLIIGAPSYEDSPMQFYPLSEHMYNGHLMGVSPIFIESKEEILCKWAMAEGPIAKYSAGEREEGIIAPYSQRHMLVEKFECIYY